MEEENKQTHGISFLGVEVILVLPPPLPYVHQGSGCVLGAYVYANKSHCLLVVAWGKSRGEGR